MVLGKDREGSTLASSKANLAGCVGEVAFGIEWLRMSVGNPRQTRHHYAVVKPLEEIGPEQL